MYELHFNEQLGLLEAKLTGFWSIETVRAYHRDFRSLVARRRVVYPLFPTVTDARNMAILSPESTSEFSQASREMGMFHKGRVAVVFGSRLAKIQAERITLQVREQGLTLDWQRFFSDMDEAMYWALATDPVPQEGTSEGYEVRSG